jgi:hypothetical protein
MLFEERVDLAVCGLLDLSVVPDLDNVGCLYGAT